MEQKFGKNSILGRAKRPSRADIEALREFCEREGKMVEYRKGEQGHGLSEGQAQDYPSFRCRQAV
jgi:hypothetical protein